MQNISGKWALVTGAGSGMGRTTALALADEGANLILLDISGEALGKVATEVERRGVKAHALSADLTDWQQVKGIADTVAARWGAIDILVNCVGIAHMASIVDTTLEDWRLIFDINLWSIIHTVKAFAPAMMAKGSGHIVNISSGQAFFAVPTWGAYACTKFAVDGYTEALGYEMSCYGVDVSCVYPGVVRTPFYESVSGGFLVKLGLKLILATVAVSPETMSRLIVKGIKKRRKHILQWFVWPIYVVRRAFPWPFDIGGRIGARVLRRQKRSGPLCAMTDGTMPGGES